MKKLSLLFFICILSISGTNAQQSISWNSSADNGNWWNDGKGNKLHWIRSCDGYWIARPDYNTCNSSSTTIGPNNITFDNNSQLSMNVNGAWFQINELTFSTNASSVRTLSTAEGGGLSFKGSNSYIKNNSTATHIFSTGISVDGSSLTINAAGGSLTFNNPININANSLIFSGNSNVTVNGVLSGTGTLTKNDASTLTFTVANTYTGTTTVTSGTLELKNSLASSTITVKTGATLKISENATINNLIVESGGTLTIVAGKTLTINAGKQVTINGTVNYNSTGKIKLLSDENGTATLTGSYSGPAEVNQYLALPRRTWYMSSPVANAQPVDMNWIKYYDEATNNWVALYDSRTASSVSYGSNSFVTGKGYSVTPNTGITNILFTGALNTGEKTIALTKGGSTSQAGFNAIGNPYPSYIDWTLLSAKTENNTILETGSMWYRTKIDATTYKYFTVDAAGVVVPANSSITKFIPPMQGFWVKTKAGGGTFYFEDNMRSHAGTTSNLLKAPAAKNSELSLLRLQVSNGTNTDEAVIYSYANATDGYDFYDSPKMMNSDAAIPEIYTTLNNQPIVINVMNNLPLDTEIGLAFVPGDATSFSLRASEITNLPSDVKVILKDNTTGTETDLTDGVTVYNFTPATTTGDRFSVIFRSAGSTTAMKTYSGNGISVYSVKNGINVTVNAELVENATVRVFNAVGQQLANQHLTNRSTTINGNFNPGVYVVKVSNGTANTTQKIVIK